MTRIWTPLLAFDEPAHPNVWECDSPTSVDLGFITGKCVQRWPVPHVLRFYGAYALVSMISMALVCTEWHFLL